MPPRKRAAGKAAGRARGAEPRPVLPEVVYAQASTRSPGGVSLFDTTRPVTRNNIVDFVSEESMIRTAASRLQAAGFQILQTAAATINIAGPPALYQDYFNITLQAEERPVVKSGGVEDTATFVECPQTDLPGLVPTGDSEAADVLEGVAIEEPIYFHESGFAPKK